MGCSISISNNNCFLFIESKNGKKAFNISSLKPFYEGNEICGVKDACDAFAFDYKQAGFNTGKELEEYLNNLCCGCLELINQENLCEPWAHDFNADSGNVKLTKSDIINQAISGGLTLDDGSPISDISQIVITVEQEKTIGFGGFISTTSHIDLTYNGGQSTLTNGESKGFGENGSVADDLCIELYAGSILSVSAVFT